MFKSVIFSSAKVIRRKSKQQRSFFSRRTSVWTRRDGDGVRWGGTEGFSVSVERRGLSRHRAFVGSVPRVQRNPHQEGVLSVRVEPTSAALPEPLPAQVENLENREADAHEAGDHHEDGEYFLLRRPEGAEQVRCAGLIQDFAFWK